MLRNQKGITLVALVVTIVVLIILATISIAIVFQDDGIVARAQDAEKWQLNADAAFKETEANVTHYIDSHINAVLTDDTADDTTEEGTGA